jgi:hypothetical protein
MLAHIDQIECTVTDGCRSSLHIFQPSYEGEDCAVVIGINAHIEKSCTFHFGKRCHDTVYLFFVPAFTDIGNAFYNFHLRIPAIFTEYIPC